MPSGSTNNLGIAIEWITKTTIANEATADPLPIELYNLFAQELVSNDFMGWSDIESARQHLDTFPWTHASTPSSV